MESSVIFDGDSFTYSTEGLAPDTVYEAHFTAENVTRGKGSKGGENGFQSDANGSFSCSFSFGFGAGWDWTSDKVNIEAWIHPLPANTVDPDTGELNTAYNRDFYAVAVTSDGQSTKATTTVN